MCRRCSFDNSYKELEKLEKKEINDHVREAIRKDKARISNALSFLILSVVAVVLSSVFFYLSFRYNVLRQRVFTPMSSEFFFSMIFLAVFISFLVAGISILVPARRRTKYFNSLLKKKKNNE